jgi:hypothetical protein
VWGYGDGMGFWGGGFVGERDRNGWIGLRVMVLLGFTGEVDLC